MSHGLIPSGIGSYNHKEIPSHTPFNVWNENNWSHRVLARIWSNGSLTCSWQFSTIRPSWDPGVPLLRVYQEDNMAQFLRKTCQWTIIHQHVNGSKWDISLLPSWLRRKEPICNAADAASMLGSGRHHGGKNGTQSSILPWEIPGTEEHVLGQRRQVRGASKEVDTLSN